jgi:lysosomal acid phosphatase
MKLQIIFLTSTLAIPCHTLDQDLSGLKLVHLLYRHGDRTPVKPYPTDPYKDLSFWPVGFGQLTSRGKMQQFELGQWIRGRYDGFLSSNYSQQEIVVRSTDVDRTLMSAMSNLAGLYPPSGYWQWNPDLAWQPIPVHTVPQEEDALLSSHAACPRFEQLHRKVLEKSKFMKNIYDENRDLFEYISANVGENVTNIVNMDYIFDTLWIENIYNMNLPKWTNKVFPGGKFEELRDLSFTVDTFNHEMK